MLEAAAVRLRQLAVVAHRAAVGQGPLRMLVSLDLPLVRELLLKPTRVEVKVGGRARPRNFSASAVR